MKILLITLICIGGVALILFTIIKNNKDRKKIEKQILNDTPVMDHVEKDTDKNE